VVVFAAAGDGETVRPTLSLDREGAAQLVLEAALVRVDVVVAALVDALGALCMAQFILGEQLVDHLGSRRTARGIVDHVFGLGCDRLEGPLGGAPNAKIGGTAGAKVGAG
jgi:hypothetical protein